MTEIKTLGQAHVIVAAANPAKGDIEVSAVFDAPPERLFRALTSQEVCQWWVRPGVFNTQEWNGDVREGGRWTASGIGGGQLYQLEGEYVAIDRPWKLSHTWKPGGAPIKPAMVTYELVPVENGVRMSLQHTGLPTPEVCEKTRVGWETSFKKLQELLQAEIKN